MYQSVEGFVCFKDVVPIDAMYKGRILLFIV